MGAHWFQGEMAIGFQKIYGEPLVNDAGMFDHRIKSTHGVNTQVLSFVVHIRDNDDSDDDFDDATAVAECIGAFMATMTR